MEEKLTNKTRICLLNKQLKHDCCEKHLEIVMYLYFLQLLSFLSYVFPQ